ncbi:carbohydrate ABC transporter permease [Amycolatopsis pithecellobii]|uniref:ABC transporter permease subunit n=1 Tax=Amycolatopsis pithecellobii TaxID=664692 RepID=A0A6N7Z9X5_9PSEU|nr:sugar ABC transporter permease [Amycolatopsis pithecellobii]MTD58532.1 ABC transporter permease subunit [Amycolatopsis pithecellobii]
MSLAPSRQQAGDVLDHTIPMTAGGPRRRQGSGLDRQRGRSGALLTLPAVAVVAALLVVPIGQALYYSMTDWDGFTARWVGPGTLSRLFANPAFWQVLRNNLLLLLIVPVAVLVPLGVATMLHAHIAGWKFFRSVYFVPASISWVVTGTFASRFFAQDGLLNHLLDDLGLHALRLDLLSHEHSALLAVGVTFVWSQLGPNTIIFVAGLANLDPALEEAARVDGAGPLRVFRSITLPQMARFIQFATVLTIVTAFTALFSLIFVMTGGGPGNGTTTLEFFVYQQAFSQGDFGYGAMLGVVLFGLVALITVIQFAIGRLLTKGN